MLHITKQLVSAFIYAMFNMKTITMKYTEI